MRKAIILLCINSLLTALAPLASAQTKYNVCSITINSSDEIQKFKERLPSDQFNFIELSPTTETFDPSSSRSKKIKDHFLKPYCVNQVRCDVLIISGHFGGTFSGTANFSLSLDDMNTLSCSNACDGVFSAPKEVFLFGCNTLAGKQKDARSPQEYIRVLVEHGYPAQEARQISNLRYGPTGGSFSDNMQRVFNHSKRIYGFNSISPRGETAARFLDAYFDSIPDYAEHLARLENKDNTELKKAFRLSAMVQTGGRQSLERDLMCEILDPTLSTEDRVTSIQKALSGKAPLGFIPAVEKAIDSDRKLRGYFNGKTLSKNLVEIFESIKNLVSLKKLLAKSLGTMEEMLPTNAFDLMNFSQKMGWFSKEEINDKKETYFSKLLFTKTEASLGKMCELRDYPIQLSAQTTSEVYIGVSSGLELKRINCLPLSNEENSFQMILSRYFTLQQQSANDALLLAYEEWIASSLNLNPHLGALLASHYVQQSDRIFFDLRLIHLGIESNAFGFMADEIENSLIERIQKNPKLRKMQVHFEGIE